jgi:NAD(P)-dependent dehydrogenase (short-subunit alcohol dehydrogenase family)
MAGVARIEGRVAVVTGGASGIGAGIAIALAEACAHVVVADVEPGPLNAVADELGALAVPTDVSKPDQVRDLAERTLDHFGRVDIVCNNAGVGHLAPFDALSEADFRWLVDVNLWGVVHGMTTFLPIIRRTGEAGHIVNTSSMAGVFTAPGMAAYAMTKFAVVGLTETVAQELEQAGSPVGVSVLLPGRVRSGIGDSERNRPDGLRTAPPQDEQVPPGRELDPIEVGRLVTAAIRDGRRYIVTHPEMLPVVRARHAQLENSFLQEKP